MKHKTHHLYYLFYPRNWIIIVLLLFGINVSAQETQTGGFIVGSPLSGIPDRRANEIYYNSFSQTGLNTVWQYAARGVNSNQAYLQDYNLIAFNHEALDWIGYYATCYYTKWEAEQAQTNLARVGVKHIGGEKVYWDSAWCWSTRNVVSQAPSLIYGPHYRQDNRYKSWAHGEDRNDVKYYTVFRMALDNQRNADPEVEVCKIKVVYSYRKCESENNCGDSVCVFREKTLTVGDFPQDGQLKDFTFDYPNDYYKYPPQFYLPDYTGKMDPSYEDEYPKYEDSYSYQGIQFVVDWLVEDPQESSLILYVDHITVFDRDWKLGFMTDSLTTAQTVLDIKGKANEYSNWSNLRYWYGHDEPYSIDAFTPIRIVDSLLDEIEAPRLTTAFNPYWTWDDSKINGDTLLSQYVRMANPEKLWIDFYPFSTLYPFRFDDVEALRIRFQLCHTLQPGFWYMAQTFGEFYEDGNNNWIPYYWRYPEDEELNATVMLALAHGSKGILFWIYDSWKYRGADYGLEHEIYYQKGLVDTVDNNQQLNPTPLWYHLKDSLVPRLKGKLGKTLMKLNYTGNYIPLSCDGCPNHDSPTLGYLTIDCEASKYNWHVGFFGDKNYSNNKYFFLTNLITTQDVTAKLTVTNNTGYENLSFTDIEGGSGRVDTTLRINASIEYFENMPAGEGRLYRVSPVVLYGGRLLYDEYAGEGQELQDDMIIENGASLTIYGDYTAKANIIVKNGSIVNGENGRIIFEDGKQLIIEGVAIINGTSGDKLSFEFNGEDTQYGIVVNSAASLTISNCTIENAETGIKAMVDAGTIDIQFVDFNDCITSSITLLGQTGGPETERQIKYCTITNSKWGISASNLPELLIQENEITNTDLGINLSNISRAIVFGNYIISNTASLQGIFAESIGGEIRTNIISGHTNGIHLGNSSPNVGGNDITDCKYHGIYVGSGSEPNMVARLIYNANNHLWYPVSGYNVMYENGGYEGGGNDNDGSEIYISDNANAIMSEGCNEIVDDREPSGNLVNTLLLMNGDNVFPAIQVEAQYNYWGETEVTVERFGDLDVNFDDWLSESCPLPYEGGEDMLITKTSTGEVIDTLYPSGEVTSPLSEIETLYSSAEGSFITGDYTSAENYYDQIILIDTSLSAKKEAYARKYEIGKLLGRGEEYFNDQRNTYLALAQTTSNTLLEKVFTQLSSLSLIGEEEYVPAISEFDEIVQQNPNTEEAVYAEIDALTTALLVEGEDSTLQKGRLGKYLIKTSGDYNQRVDEILRKHFGGSSKETEEDLLPIEYTLYQNYPNPFNPTTTIKYDLPNTSEVSLIIYDILGRKVKELVNAKQQAGWYEVQFNASSLASGVYIYQLIAEKYISSKKMILLK